MDRAVGPPLKRQIVDAKTHGPVRIPLSADRRFDRLNSVAALIARRPECLSTAPFAPFLVLQYFLAVEHRQPTREGRLGEAMLPAVQALRQAAVAPGLDVDPPPLAPRRVLELFRDLRSPPKTEGTRFAAPEFPAEQVQDLDPSTSATDGKIKAPPPARRMWLVLLGYLATPGNGLAGASVQRLKEFNAPSAIAPL